MPAGPAEYIESHVRRVSRNLLIWNGLFAGLILLILSLNARYLHGFFTGPRPVDDDYLLHAADPDATGLIAYIELKNRDLLPTGYIEETTRGERVHSRVEYFFVRVRDRVMIVKGAGEGHGQRLIGPLQHVSVKTDQELWDQLTRRNPALTNEMLPILLNAEAAYTVWGYVLLGLMTPVLMLLTWNILRALTGFSWPAMHPVVRSLSRYGDPIKLAESIDEETAKGPTQTIWRSIATPHWVLRPTPFNLVLCPIPEIVWAYHMRISGDDFVVVSLRDGRQFGIPTHGHADELLTHLSRHVPWAERGFSKELQERWKNQRPEMIEAVERRRAEMQG